MIYESPAREMSLNVQHVQYQAISKNDQKSLKKNNENPELRGGVFVTRLVLGIE